LSRQFCAGKELAARQALWIAVRVFCTKADEHFLVENIEGHWPPNWPKTALASGMAYAVAQGWLAWTETVGAVRMTDAGRVEALTG